MEFATPVAVAAAGTELPSWPAAAAADEPTALTALPTADATGGAGLVLPGAGGEPVALLPVPGEPPDAAGEPGVTEYVAGPTSETRPVGAVPERSPGIVGPPDDGPPDPAEAVSDPLGAVGPADAGPGFGSPLCGCAVSCF